MMKWIRLLLIVILFAGCAHQTFTVVPEKNRGNERPLVYDSSEIPTIFGFQDEIMEMKVALHSREFPNGILWSLSLETPIDTILPLKMFAFQDGNTYELIRLQSDQNYPNLAYYVLPPNFIKNCRFLDELTFNVKIGNEELSKMNGLKATRVIKDNPAGAETKIIALTAHALEEKRYEILKSGCNDFLRKLYRENDIYNALAHRLGLEYEYKKVKNHTSNIASSRIDLAQLGKLPPTLLDKLSRSTNLFDSKLSLQAAATISEHNTELGEQLRQMITEFKFKDILTSLDQAIPRNDI